MNIVIHTVLSVFLVNSDIFWPFLSEKTISVVA